MTKGRDVLIEVAVSLDTIIELEGVDPFNDYLCELTEEPLLQDIGWRITGIVNPYPYALSEDRVGLTLMVSGYVEEEE